MHGGGTEVVGVNSFVNGAIDFTAGSLGKIISYIYLSVFPVNFCILGSVAFFWKLSESERKSFDCSNVSENIFNVRIWEK